MELYHNDRGKPAKHKKMEWSQILKNWGNIGRINRNKVAGQHGIKIEMLWALDDYRIDKIIEIINELYDNDDITEDLSRSIFKALYKKLDYRPN